MPAEVLHGLTFAAMWAAANYYANRLAPAELKSTVLGLVTGIHWGLGFGLGSVGGGFVYSIVGAQECFLLSAALPCTSLVLLLIGGRRSGSGAGSGAAQKQRWGSSVLGSVEDKVHREVGGKCGEEKDNFLLTEVAGDESFVQRDNGERGYSNDIEQNATRLLSSSLGYKRLQGHTPPAIESELGTVDTDGFKGNQVAPSQEESIPPCVQEQGSIVGSDHSPHSTRSGRRCATPPAYSSLLSLGGRAHETEEVELVSMGEDGAGAEVL
ncbi:unnamed protein product [Choristocarpus tenellus]